MSVLPNKESLTVEFKSDVRQLPDHALVEAVVCMTNAEGGVIYLGVEDDGRVTGLHAKHENLEGLPAMIANLTSPPVAVRVASTEHAGVHVAEITVPKATRIVSTSQGLTKRRRLGWDGRPECVPLLPEEHPSRLSDLGVLDSSSLPVPGAELTDLDPVERGRFRQFIERFRGDRALLDLSDEELDGAMGLVVRDGEKRTPTLAGLLLLGREARLRELVPTHEVAFQVLDGEEVRVNEFTRGPLLRVFDWLDTLFTSLNTEQEFLVGLFRVSVPRVDRTAYREAVANALTHRDYARLGAVHVRLESNSLVISNPGGFVAGVTTHNLLTTEPRARNSTLADAFKRAGIVERTGRGVDRIFRGLLRYGRAFPDYSASSATSVVLRLAASPADLDFVRLVVTAENAAQAALPVDSLIGLSCLREQRRITSDELAIAIQKDRPAAKRTLEGLVEAGLAEAHGTTSGRSYTLSKNVYVQAGHNAEYTRQAGFERVQQEEMVLNYARQHGALQRSDVVKLCHITDDQATRLLTKLVKSERLKVSGTRRWTRYRVPEGSS